ncbi:LysE/ArgO family amino acid transporter [Desulfovibrio cuneatus]|uniref:LysE/ArgO family amino acid transporter n=1 Tax=Desulfovibrio cuneatus TaxID=159728 RepID=UPI00041652A7|nr:LysE/ArgO family amino acid transporter [Desulfovibrio cuneatus]
MISAYLSGFATGASLIIAIGAQNAFVLVQGIRREYHIICAALCATLDALLIAAGVLGVGTFVASNPYLRLGSGIGGALFLAWFGAGALRSAIHAGKMDVSTQQAGGRGLRQTVLALLAVSLLNPHVYLDTVVLLGAISGNYAGDGRYFFGAGAITASVVWFFCLALGGALLAPVFARPLAWRVLYLIVCGMVWLVAAGLAVDVWGQVILLQG